jgi:threonine aldolase
MRPIDLRSDTVTAPTPAMRVAMLAAAVGDDVYGEDPTVIALQDRVAADLGFEAALFVPSGTQANLIALLCHCTRGDEYIVGMDAHTYRYEGGGAAVLGSIQPQPLPQQSDGTMPIDAIEAAIKPDDPHYARTRLLALENTWHGRALPAGYLAQARGLCDRRGLALHLDGARLFNAAVAGSVPARDIAAHFDSVSVCLSKGLGAPVGSVLAATQALIEQGRRWRKMLGGGWRQAGILAAAGLHSLAHHVDRLADDHANAARLADGLRVLDGFTVDGPHTNMVFVHLAAERRPALTAHLREAGIIVAGGYGPTLRLVTHLDVDAEGIDRAIESFARFSGA